MISQAIKYYIIIISLIVAGCGKPDQSASFEANSPESKGLDIFTRMACHACHSTDGSLKLGPTIRNQYGQEIRHTDGSLVVIDDHYIRESLLEPLKYIAEGYTPIMPSYKPVLKEKEIEYLIAYIKALK